MLTQLNTYIIQPTVSVQYSTVQYSISIIELLSTQFMQLVFIGSQDYFEKPQTTVCPRSRDPLYAVSRYI